MDIIGTGFSVGVGVSVSTVTTPIVGIGVGMLAFAVTNYYIERKKSRDG